MNRDESFSAVLGALTLTLVSLGVVWTVAHTPQRRQSKGMGAVRAKSIRTPSKYNLEIED